MWKRLILRGKICAPRLNSSSSWKCNVASVRVNNSRDEREACARSRLRTVGSILLVLILVAALSYLFVLKPHLTTPATVVSLTTEQKEVDDCLRKYYLAYGNGSVSRLTLLFDDAAILSAPDGSVHKGLSEISHYYAELFVGYEGAEIRTKVLGIEIRGKDAHASYNVGLRTWHFGATEPPQFFYKDSFDLRKTGDTWKITALLTETS
jgi:ketosteroid isomerase-like protein